jgi:hypothetical protein
MGIAVTIDIVGSRRLGDRDGAQRAIDETLASVARDLDAMELPIHPTVGDELQGVYRDLDGALASVLLIRLALPDAVDCRFGLGIGELRSVPSASGDIPEGPGWWAAREAIDTVHRLQQRAVPSARTWVAASADSSDDMRGAARRANVALLARDELVGAMSARTRRLTYGRCVGVVQRELAETEGITQSAVSQALSAAGSAAVVEGYRLLVG